MSFIQMSTNTANQRSSISLIQIRTIWRGLDVDVIRLDVNSHDL